MASLAPIAPVAKPLTPDTYERILSGGAVILLVAVVAALSRGHSEWHRVPANVWAHLATIMLALTLTPVMLLRPRGDTLHRQLGWIWVTAMIATALISFTVRNSNHGGFGVIHILSAWVLFQVPFIVLAARRHKVTSHRTRVRAMVTGALLIAGFFTFPFNRLLGHWLFA